MSETVENTVEETSAPVMFTLNFSEEELNKILNIIAQLPYSSVFTLINNIQAQAQAQVQARTVA